MKKTSILVLAAGASLLLGACGGGEDSKAEKERQAEDYAASHGIDADVTVDESGDVSNVVVNQGNSRVGNDLDLPSDFPSDIGVLSGWSVIGTTPVPPDGYSVQAMNEASVKETADAIQLSMENNGWALTAASDPNAQMSQLAFEKGDRMANFNVIDSGGKSTVQLVTMTKPE